MSSEMKKCTGCKRKKVAQTEFYKSQGKIRSECKSCIIRKNTAYQTKRQTWKHRFIDAEGQRSYMLDYYAKNKQKFVEYRRKFKERHPDYHREYNRKKKNAR